MEDFSHGVKDPQDSGACAQIACVKTREVSSHILAKLLLDDMPVLVPASPDDQSEDSVADETDVPRPRESPSSFREVNSRS